MSAFKQLMEEKGYNGNRLSIDSGVPVMTINDLKNNKSQFKKTKVETAIKISKVLDMTVNEIYDYLEGEKTMKLTDQQIENELSIIFMEADEKFNLEDGYTEEYMDRFNLDKLIRGLKNQDDKEDIELYWEDIKKEILSYAEAFSE